MKCIICLKEILDPQKSTISTAGPMHIECIGKPLVTRTFGITTTGS